MTYENIILEKRQGGIYLITVNRPDQLNALSRQTVVEFAHAITGIETDPLARVLMLSGAGEKAFIAGADIREFKGLDPLQARELAQTGQKVLGQIEQLSIPVIAVVNGFALGGGCEFALACDWMIASDNAKFGQPEIKLGIMPGFGGSQRLLRLVGKSMAMELCMTGRMIDANEAKQLGLVNRVVSADSLMDEADKLAHSLSQKPPVALKFIKQVMQRGQNMGLDDACTLEAELFSLCFSTEDQNEGVAAFLEKRDAKFTGI